MPMSSTSSNAKLESEVLERDVRIRAAIREEHELLLRSIAVLVAKTRRGLRWLEVMEIASEILQEAVQEALKHAGRFDPARSATAWVRGIAAKLLLNRQRAGSPSQALGSRGRPWRGSLGRRARAALHGTHRRGGRRTARSGAGTRSHLSRRATGHRIPLLPGAGRRRAGKGPGGFHSRGRTRTGLPGASALRTHFAPAEEEVFP